MLYEQRLSATKLVAEPDGRATHTDDGQLQNAVAWQQAVGARDRARGVSELERLAESLSMRKPTRYEVWVKPVLDRLVAGVLILVLLPILLAVTLAVLLMLHRPVFFTQIRAGHNGRPFSMLKFRTMRPDRRVAAVQFDGPDRRKTHKSADDPRHTPLGSLMRKLSIDELPQLFNVLRGEMSLVGPRPELIELTYDYADWQRSRQLVRPGLTGLWQTTERGKGLQLHECIDLDLDYIRGLSFRRDMAILLRTPVALLSTKGVI